MADIPKSRELSTAESIALLLRVSEYIEKLFNRVYADPSISTGITLVIKPATLVGGGPLSVYSYLDSGVLVSCEVSSHSRLLDILQLHIVKANGTSCYSKIITEDLLRQFAVDSRKHIRIMKNLITRLTILGLNYPDASKRKVPNSMEDDLRAAIESIKSLFERK